MIISQTRMLVLCEAIITQLIFDHSLRIRMKAETADTPAPSRVTTAAHTPDNASIAELDPTEADASGTSSSEDGTTVRASTISATSTTATAAAKGKEPPKKAEEPAPAPKDESTPSGNLIGKINNLVSTDLNNIIDGRDFLFLGTCFCGLLVRG